MKHYILISQLLICAFLYGQKDSTRLFRPGVFPEQWDTNMNLRSGHLQVLAWLHKKDSRPLEVRSCLMLRISTDSLGQKSYILSHKFTNEKPYKVWNDAYIHYGPGTGQVMGYYDFHIKQFDHKPGEQEIDALLKRWQFAIPDDGWHTIASGFDMALWMDVFGFDPSKILNN